MNLKTTTDYLTDYVMTYTKKSNYKTISWTIKDQSIIDQLQPYCQYGKSPQEYVRRLLADQELIREKATTMNSQVNFPSISLGESFKLSLYTEDHTMLKEAAQECGLTIQQLLHTVLKDNQ